MEFGCWCHHSLREDRPKSAVDLFFILKYARWRLPLRQKYQSFVEDKYGVEISGPSTLFKTVLPLYQFVRGLDGVNFSTDTIWEGRIKTGENFNYYHNKRGRQFIVDATDLDKIATARYDFLLSSNCLEHVANPIKALVEWKRVIKAGGGLILVVPNKEKNFDHRRPVTKFEHLLDDFTRDVGEGDLTHLDEILALHDLRMDWPAGDTCYHAAQPVCKQVVPGPWARHQDHDDDQTRRVGRYPKCERQHGAPHQSTRFLRAVPSKRSAAAVTLSAGLVIRVAISQARATYCAVRTVRKSATSDSWLVLEKRRAVPTFSRLTAAPQSG